MSIATTLKRTGYVLVTPVRDEVRTIGCTIESVVNQTVLPAEWIIVSDGSSDGTDDLVKSAIDTHPWMRLITLPPRAGRDFAAVVCNTQRGIAALRSTDYEYLGLLDADLAFAPDYFQRLIEHFERHPRLGVAGGVVVDPGQPRDAVPRNRIDVPGAVQLFRRGCFEAIGGLLPLPEGGWDVLTCALARMRGFETQLVTTLVVDHLKPRNISQGPPLRRLWQLGVRDYAVGYHPGFEVVKCVARLTERPVGIASCARWLGFCAAHLSRRPRVTPSEIVRFVRHEQTTRLRRTVGV
jgi:glycosyltransferase involved in cell wall biosynthesis